MLIVSFLYALVCAPQDDTTPPPVPEQQAIALFDIKPQNQIEVFVAADIKAETAEGIAQTLNAAVLAWGSTGRLEYWVVGADRDAAIALSDKFCKRRVERGDMTARQCRRDRTDEDHGFLMYQKIGADALAKGRASMSAGHNGGSEWGIHRYSSSLPLGFSNLLEIQAEGDQLTVLHEYWHSVQMSFIHSQEHDVRQKQMGPVWFAEGSAVAMAEITSEKLWANGRLPRWNNSDRPWPNLKERMINKMNFIQENRKKCDTVLPDTYEGECAQLAYESGGWAIAYLIDRHGEDVLRKEFHPRVAELGWEGAFQKTFGQTPAEFIVEYENFLDLPIEKQIEILPTF